MPETLLDERLSGVRIATWNALRAQGMAQNHCYPIINAVVAAVEAHLASLQPSVSEMMGWLPIETAPRDGSEILAYSEHGCTGTMLVRHIAPCDFLTEAEADQWASEGATDLEEADWFAADFIQGDRLSPDCYPTHWMPLPNPPALSPEGEP